MSSRRKPRVVSLFSGCGGSSLGYKQAGYRVMMAADIDPHAVETYKLNFKRTPVWDRDVQELTPAIVKTLTGLDPGELDVLDGSPPCQGFSTSGHREVFDERNFLFLEFVRLLAELQPRAFVMENVSGMIKGQHRWIFSQVFKRLENAGYRVKAQLLDASRLGVPQRRTRVIFVGVRKDLDIAPVHPSPQDTITHVRQAFAGLPEDSSRTLGELGFRIWSQTPPGQNFSKHHPKGHWFNAVKLHPRRPAMTLAKTVMTTGAAGLFHWTHPRCLNELELRRVSTFPDDFEVRGGLVKTWERFGNAVPPKMMEAIARTVRTEILNPA